jgi:hypothetical protein
MKMSAERVITNVILYIVDKIERDEIFYKDAPESTKSTYTARIGAFREVLEVISRELKRDESRSKK